MLIKLARVRMFTSALCTAQRSTPDLPTTRNRSLYMKRTIRAGAIAALGVAAIALTLLAAGVVVTLAALAAVAPDIIPEIRKDLNESRLYEDGSYIYSVGNFSIVGCAPIHPWNNELVTGWCMDGGTNPLGHIKRGVWEWKIGVDSPWEDFAPEPIANFLYWFIETFIKSRYQNH